MIPTIAVNAQPCQVIGVHPQPIWVLGPNQGSPMFITEIHHNRKLDVKGTHRFQNQVGKRTMSRLRSIIPAEAAFRQLNDDQ